MVYGYRAQLDVQLLSEEGEPLNASSVPIHLSSNKYISTETREQNDKLTSEAANAYEDYLIEQFARTRTNPQLACRTQKHFLQTLAAETHEEGKP